MAKSTTIFILSKAEGTPYGWEFINLYHAREFIKRMCNRNGNITTLGGEDLKSFTNLTATLFNTNPTQQCYYYHVHQKLLF